MASLPAGYFGKLPSRGDFIQANLPADFVAAWDQWLQSVIVQAQAELGDDWRAAYLAMPIWHFALSGNICGDAPMVGILVTSVDSAGRYFPVTLAVNCAQPEQGPGLPLLLAERLDVAYALEDIALAALQDGARLEDFTNQIESLPLPQKCRFLTSQAEGDRSTSLMQSLVREGLLAKRADWSGTSLWWAKWGDETRMIGHDGLPSANQFATILLKNGDMTTVQPTQTESLEPQEVAVAELVSPEQPAEEVPPEETPAS
jgi:type VI secretion system protein ImpM